MAIGYEETSSTHCNTLIVGAGVAGLTLAALLQRRGNAPTIIEQQTRQSFYEAGYMLGLLPLGGRVLNALNAQRAYLENSCLMQEYAIFDGKGNKLNSFPLTKINENFGPYRGISRIELIKILHHSAGDIPIQFNSTITSIKQNEEDLIVTFSNGSTHIFDLVVVADGLHSKTKLQILDEQEFAYRQTGWGGWVTWVDRDPQYANSYNEFWGAGAFLGLYPVKDQIGAFIGGPLDKLKKIGRRAFTQNVQQNFKKTIPPVREALHSFKTIDELYFWNFHDCKTQRWRDGRVILLGDAATGFLPTAGMGASMAMDSAAALDDELSRADKKHLGYALELYENRQRAKVEKAQKESRTLGKWMFINSKAWVWLRNKMLNFYGLDSMLKEFETIMKGE